MRSHVKIIQLDSHCSFLSGDLNSAINLYADIRTSDGLDKTRDTQLIQLYATIHTSISPVNIGDWYIRENRGRLYRFDGTLQVQDAHKVLMSTEPLLITNQESALFNDIFNKGEFYENHLPDFPQNLLQAVMDGDDLSEVYMNYDIIKSDNFPDLIKLKSVDLK